MKTPELCGHGARLEYCPDETEANEANADIVIAAIDTLLYETEAVRQIHFGMRDRVITRAFSFIEQLDVDGAAIERTVWLQHDTSYQPMREAYNIQLEWRPLSSVSTEAVCQKTYAVDKYVAGAQGAVDRQTILLANDGELYDTTEQSVMTAYDYGELFDALVAFNKRHDRERQVARTIAARKGDL